MGREPLSDGAVAIFKSALLEMDQAASRFRTDSELSVVFDGSARTNVKISPMLFKAIEAALLGATITSGYLDPTVGDTLVGLGYGADFSVVARAGQEKDTLHIRLPIGYRKVSLNPARGTASVPEGTRLDLGSTGKAFLADTIRFDIESTLGERVLVNLGGDIAASSLSQGEYWPIRITDDFSLDATSSGVMLGLYGGGLATSSTARRHWIRGETSLHHIVDPFTGTSADSPFDAVSVLAGSALEANIASAGTIAMGVKGPEWLKGLGLPALARSKGVRRKFAGWDGFLLQGGGVEIAISGVN